MLGVTYLKKLARGVPGIQLRSALATCPVWKGPTIREIFDAAAAVPNDPEFWDRLLAKVHKDNPAPSDTSVPETSPKAKLAAQAADELLDLERLHPAASLRTALDTQLDDGTTIRDALTSEQRQANDQAAGTSGDPKVTPELLAHVTRVTSIGGLTASDLRNAAAEFRFMTVADMGEERARLEEKFKTETDKSILESYKARDFRLNIAIAIRTFPGHATKPDAPPPAGDTKWPDSHSTDPVTLEEMLNRPNMPFVRVQQFLRAVDAGNATDVDDENGLSVADEVTIVKRHLLTTEQRNKLHDIGLDVSDLLAGDYDRRSENVEEMTTKIVNDWNTRLGFNYF